MTDVGAAGAIPRPGDARFVGSIPEHYHRYLGPLLFAPYADDLARRVAAGVRTGPVLEIAAGTGMLTERLRATLPDRVGLVASDLNEPMLDVARARIGRGVEWRQADATALPFEQASFDTVVCQFGIMFVPDKGRAAREANRVLRRGGRWIFNVWGSLEENPIALVTQRVMTELFPDDPPQFYRVPYGFHDPFALRTLALSAGFTDVTLTDLRLALRSPSARDAATGLVRGNPLAAAIEARGGSVDAAIDTLAGRLGAELGDAPLSASSMVRVVEARKP